MFHSNKVRILLVFEKITVNVIDRIKVKLLELLEETQIRIIRWIKALFLLLENINFRKSLPRAPEFEYPLLLTYLHTYLYIAIYTLIYQNTNITKKYVVLI